MIASMLPFKRREFDFQQTSLRPSMHDLGFVKAIDRFDRRIVGMRCRRFRLMARRLLAATGVIHANDVVQSCTIHGVL